MLDYSKLVLGREADEKEIDALKQAFEILEQANLILIGARPKDR